MLSLTRRAYQGTNPGIGSSRIPERHTDKTAGQEAVKFGISRGLNSCRSGRTTVLGGSLMNHQRSVLINLLALTVSQQGSYAGYSTSTSLQRHTTMTLASQVEAAVTWQSTVRQIDDVLRALSPATSLVVADICLVNALTHADIQTESKGTDAEKVALKAIAQPIMLSIISAALTAITVHMVMTRGGHAPIAACRLLPGERLPQ